MLTYLLAVLATCANATSSVLLRKANRKAPQRHNLSPKLIWSLAREPVWFGGILAIIAGFLLQASALGSGELAVVLAIGAGAALGLTAALKKGMADTYAQGFGALFTTWELYGMIATGVLGFFLVQSAMNAGRLIAAQPGPTLTDPLVWGVLAFHEHIRGGWHAGLAVVSGLDMAFAVVTLARSPLLSESSEAAEERQPVGAPGGD
jgi:protein-S-isoprenylcysteine O-methyltransferase Ste14